MPDLQSELQRWLQSMKPTPPREQGDRHARDEAANRTFIEKLRDKIAEDARAENGA